jgi:hypothetical protein
MNEPIKMTDGELLEVRSLQEKFQQNIYAFGQLYLQKIQVEKTQQSLKEQQSTLETGWSDLQKSESELIEKLLKKYGEGALDLKAGTFIPDKKIE